MNNKKKCSFFSHRECEHFPCHPGVDPERFNCLFCFCPLYTLGKDCGGNFTYTEEGLKDCSNCTFPHRAENYDAVCARCGEIVKRMKQ